MKVILLVDVKGKGKKDQIVEVAPGFAMHLIKENKAVEASTGSLKVINKKQEEVALELAKAHEKALKDKDFLETKMIEFKLKAGKDGRVFKSISSKQIVERVFELYKIKIDKRKFTSNVKINTLGVTKVDVELAKGVVATLSIAVKEI